MFTLYLSPFKSEEEVRGLQKKIQQIENELDLVQENLTQANSKLEEKEKTLQTVSWFLVYFPMFPCERFYACMVESVC